MSNPKNYDVKIKLSGQDKKTYIAVNLIVLKVPAGPAVCQLQLAKKAASEDNPYVSVLITPDAYLSVDELIHVAL